jgi:hypothetical protein
MSTRRGSPTQVADSIPFDTTGSDFDPSTVFTVADALRDLDNITIDTLTEFEAFGSAGLETTTSNGWVTKSGYPYTTTSKSPGDYIVNYTAQIGNNSNNTEIGFRAQWRLGTSGTWIDLVDIRRQVPRGGDTILTTGFSIVTLPASGVFQVRIEYGQTDSGGTGSIQEANITIGKVSA